MAINILSLHQQVLEKLETERQRNLAEMEVIERYLSASSSSVHKGVGDRYTLSPSSVAELHRLKRELSYPTIDMYLCKVLRIVKEYTTILNKPIPPDAGYDRFDPYDPIGCLLHRKAEIEQSVLSIIKALAVERCWFDIVIPASTNTREKVVLLAHQQSRHQHQPSAAGAGAVCVDQQPHDVWRSSSCDSSSCTGSASKSTCSSATTPPPPPSRRKTPVVFCTNCSNTDVNLVETDEFNKKTCTNCSSQINLIETGHTHQDYNRVNIVSKFVYNRVMHFRDCIRQFQGKQNCKIPDKVYTDLIEKFKAYRLLVESDNCYVRFSRITIQHILMFLKELKHNKHYENVNVIYHTLTNKQVADISHLEDKLIDDFKQLVGLYDKLHSKNKPQELDRKNFMNVHYLLFQLLSKNGYKCKLADFSILKTTDRKLFHDKICSNLFQKLGWNFTPTF